MSIYSQTPLRISFLGGGSDYVEYFEENEAAVLGGSINKFIYIFELPMSSFAPKKYKLSYRQTEEVDDPSEFEHPVVSSVLRDLNWREPINISTMSDIPGGTGLGSSSAFSVGFIKLTNHLIGNNIDKITLAKEAYRIEHDILNENVGIQDHLHAAFGGFNLYKMQGKSITIEPIQMKSSFKRLLNNSLIMVFTGQSRHASKVLEDQISRTKKSLNTPYIKELVTMTKECAGLFNTTYSDDVVIEKLGDYLHQSWELKKSFSKKISNENIDDIYKKGISLGAKGGKLCGAGGGGFVLFLVEPDIKKKFTTAFGAENVLEIELTNDGSQIRGI